MTLAFISEMKTRDRPIKAQRHQQTRIAKSWEIQNLENYFAGKLYSKS